MIKRPLLPVAAAFILGIFMFRQELDVRVLLLGIGIFYICLVSLYNFKIFSLKYDIFLLFLPVIFLIGGNRIKSDMKQCIAETGFARQEYAVIEGTVQNVQKSKNKDKIYINNINFISETELSCCGAVILYIDNDEGVEIGNVIRAYGKISSFKKATNPGQFDEYDYYKALGICAKYNVESIEIINAEKAGIKVFINKIKYKFTETYFRLFPEKEAGIITAMILGEKAYMEDEIKNLYQENGISHILAVSGLHMSLIGMGIYNIFRKLRGRLMPSVIAASLLIICYAYMTGFSVSAERAMVMLLLMLAAKMIGCTYDIISALSLAAMIILYKQPLMLFQAGFLLSFGAVASIAFIHPALISLFDKEKMKGLYPFVNSLMISISVQIVTMPVILYYYYVIPTYGIFLNLLILPLMSFIAAGAVIAGIVGSFGILLGKFIGGGAYFILKLYELLCISFEKLPYHQLVIGKPEVIQIIFYCMLAVVIVAVCRITKRKAILILMFLLFFTVKKDNPEGIETVFLDVGQGDSIYVKNHYGTSFLFDGGSTDILNVGKYRLKPFLLSYGIGKVDYVFISHSDNDHVNGIVELIELDMVSTLVMPEITNKGEKYIEIENLAKKRGIDLLYFSKGSMILEEDFLIHCYGPNKGMNGSDANAASMILEISYGEFSLLLTGDADVAAEIDTAFYRASVAGKKDRASILKVSHHGSDYSSCATFLEAVNPFYSIISCSKFNSYGHPGKNTLERIKATGSSILITADQGAIMIKSNGHILKTTTYVN